MRLEEFRAALQRRPFTPVRVFLTDGGSYEITHPDLCLLLRRTAIIGYPAASGEGEQGDRYAVFDLAHVSCMESSGQIPAGPAQEQTDPPNGD